MKMLANQSACNYEMHELVKSKLSIDYRIINRASGRDVLPLTHLRNFYWIVRRNLFPETSRKGTRLIGKTKEPCLLVRLIFLIKPVIRFHLNPRKLVTDRLKVIYQNFTNIQFFSLKLRYQEWNFYHLLDDTERSILHQLDINIKTIVDRNKPSNKVTRGVYKYKIQASAWKITR